MRYRLSHHPNALIKRPDDRLQLSVERLQQCLLPAVADSHPKQFARVTLPVGKMKKILISIDDRLLVRLDQLKGLFRGVDDEIDSTQVIREMCDSR